MNARLVLSSLLAGIVITTSASAQVSNLIPPDTARLIEVEGRSTRVLTVGWQHVGEGVPVVVFESGGGGDRIEAWGDVIEAVSQFAPAVAYERPGVGGSEPDDAPPSIDHLGQNLREVLRALGADPPFVLVGHSFGGPLIRHFARRYPEAVSGLVFVDATVLLRPREESIAVFESIGAGETELQEYENVLRRFVEQMPPGPRAEIRAVEDELRSSPQSWWRPDVPLAVLQAGRYDPPPPDIEFSFDYRAYHEANVRHEVHRLTDWVLEAPTGTFVLARGAGHYLHRDDPALVVAVVRDIVEKASAP